MKLLVTGASGWIGSAGVIELPTAGHHITGLAQTDEASAKIGNLGAEVARGSLDDFNSLCAAVGNVEGVVWIRRDEYPRRSETSNTVYIYSSREIHYSRSRTRHTHTLLFWRPL